MNVQIEVKTLKGLWLEEWLKDNGNSSYTKRQEKSTLLK